MASSSSPLSATLLIGGLPEFVFAQVSGEFVKGGQHKLTRVYESDFKGRVALNVIGDGSDFSMTWLNSWQHKASVISWTQYSNIYNNYKENT